MIGERSEISAYGHPMFANQIEDRHHERGFEVTVEVEGDCGSGAGEVEADRHVEAPARANLEDARAFSADAGLIQPDNQPGAFAQHRKRMGLA